MNDYEIVASEAVEIANKNDQNGLYEFLEKQDMETIVSTILPVMNDVAGKSYQMVENVYIAAMERQLQNDLRTAQNKEFVVRSYNDHMDKLLDKISDIGNKDEVDGVIRIIDRFSADMQKQLEAMEPKGGFFKRIFGR